MNHFEWTGNPFVDTGLAVLVAKAQKQSLAEVTKDDFKNVFSDIKWLGNTNRKLKAYSLVIGTNGPLTQPGFSKDTLEKSLIKQLINTAFLEYSGNKFSGIEGIRLLAHKYNKKPEDLTLNDFDSFNSDERWKRITKQLLNDFSGLLGNADRLIPFKIKKCDPPDKQLNEKITAKNSNAKQTSKLQQENRSELEVLKRRISAPLDWQLSQYSIFIETLLEDVISNKHQVNALCEVTGLKATNALEKIPSRMGRELELSPSEKSKIEAKKYQIGRDWFPLAGSLGNDAQSLPAGSRSPYISSLALLMAQLLPMGVVAISRNVNGKIKSYLVCLQFNVPEVNTLIVKDIYDKVMAKIDFATEKKKLKTIGTEKGSKSLALFLLNKFRELKDHKEFHDIHNLHLNVWMFSNFGTGADCDYFEIPNPSLQFLQTAASSHYEEIRGLLSKEVQTGCKYSLLDAIERKEDYEPLYPHPGSKPMPSNLRKRIESFLRKTFAEDESESLLNADIEGEKPQPDQKVKKPKKATIIEQLEKKAKSEKRNQETVEQIHNLILEIKNAQCCPASKELFWFYQTEVVGRDQNTLTVAERIAWFLSQSMTTIKDSKILDEMKRNDFKKHTVIREQMIKMASEGLLTLDEYTSLFPIESHNPLKVSGQGWKYIWFYLNHSKLENNQTNFGDKTMFTHPKVKTFAQDYFKYFMGKHNGSLRKFELYILEPFERGQISSRSMQEWFCELAKVHDSYTSEEWDDLCKDDNGNDAIYEVRFQLRLHFTNLYREFKERTRTTT